MINYEKHETNKLTKLLLLVLDNEVKRNAKIRSNFYDSKVRLY